MNNPNDFVEKWKHIVEQSKQKLSQNKDEWEKSFTKYADNIYYHANLSDYDEITKLCQVNPPLMRYTCVSNFEIGKKTYHYDLRVLGRSIGTLFVKNNKLWLSVNNQKANNNKKVFNIDSGLNFWGKEEVEWRSNEGEKFRSNFEKKDLNNIKLSPEAKIESRLLKVFEEETAKTLGFPIRPIKILKCYFQMPTPLKASSHDPNYAKSQYGGRIDIMARVGSGKSNRIVIMELKDEAQKKGETQPEVMIQALIYATFIAKLLKSDATTISTNNKHMNKLKELGTDYLNTKLGNKWYGIFKSKNEDERIEPREVPKDIELDVVTVMRYDKEQLDPMKEIGLNNQKFKIDENITLNLYSLYFKVKDGDDWEKNIEFSGTYKALFNK